MQKIELKYHGEKELLDALASLRKVGNILKISKPKHGSEWDKVYIDIIFLKL